MWVCMIEGIESRALMVQKWYGDFKNSSRSSSSSRAQNQCDGDLKVCLYARSLLDTNKLWITLLVFSLLHCDRFTSSRWNRPQQIKNRGTTMHQQQRALSTNNHKTHICISKHTLKPSIWRSETCITAAESNISHDCKAKTHSCHRRSHSSQNYCTINDNNNTTIANNNYRSRSTSNAEQ